MPRLTSALFVFAIALGAMGSEESAQVPTDAANTRTKLAALERLWNQAQMNHDSKAIASMIGERFVYTESNGAVSNFEKFLVDFTDTSYKPSLMNVQNVNVDLYGAAAVVTGDYHTKGTVDGKPFEHFGRFTDTWVFQGGKWLCVASHSSQKR